MEDFIALHQAQLELSGVPRRYWETIYSKIKLETFDAGDWFMMQLVEDGSEYEDDLDVGDEALDMDDDVVMATDNRATYDEGDETEGGRLSWRVIVSCPQGIDLDDPQHVYLIDHAWTFRLEQARAQLENNSALLRRMTALMNVRGCEGVPGRTEDEVIEDVMREMWKYNQTYNIATAKLGTEAALPVWYVMDEFGSRIQHSDSASVTMVPFCYVPTQTSYTLMWPARSLQEGDEVTRDYLSGRAVSDPLMRKLLLLPWQPDDMRHLTYDVKEDKEAFSSKYTVHKTTPNLSMTFPSTPPRDRKVRLYCDVEQVHKGLTDERFEFVDSPDEADVIWTRQYLSDFKAFSEDTPNKFINQFPFEMILTVKDLLAVVSRRAGSKSPDGGMYIDRRTLESRPPWVPTTFNLRSELSQFVSYYQHRAARGLDNHWSCKPFNLARSLDTWITDDLNCLLRLAESGPKIASKYVIDPVLLKRSDVGHVKFDLRFIVMVISVSPLELVVHQKFIVRVANKVFSLDHLDDYEKHFTVMNYKKGVNLKKISCEEFVEMFEAQYTEIKWSTVLEDIYKTIRDLFTAAVVQPPPAGISPSPQSRAIYGIDVMLRWADDPAVLAKSLGRGTSIVSIGEGMFKTGRYKSSSESSGVSMTCSNDEGLLAASRINSPRSRSTEEQSMAGRAADEGVEKGAVWKNGDGPHGASPSGGGVVVNGGGDVLMKNDAVNGGVQAAGVDADVIKKDDVVADARGGQEGAAAKARTDSGSSSESSSGTTDGEMGEKVEKIKEKAGGIGKGPLSGGGDRKIQPVVLECNFGPDNTRLINAYPEFFNDIFSTLFFLDIEGRPVDPL